MGLCSSTDKRNGNARWPFQTEIFSFHPMRKNSIVTVLQFLFWEGKMSLVITRLEKDYFMTLSFLNLKKYGVYFIRMYVYSIIYVWFIYMYKIL